MPRPIKCRKIGYSPDFYFFKPAAIPGKLLQEVVLSIDEFEAVRLADYEGLYQEEAAKLMNISRQTFGNIILSARYKISDVLVNGKILKIQGGSINMLKERHFNCYDCQHEWSIPFGINRPQNCPSCQSANIHRAVKEQGMRYCNGKKRGFRHGCRNSNLKVNE